MKQVLAIMQPYFFPYIGYFQLINAVDTFVLYDDVNYIKRGWIARNRILIQGNASYLTMQLQGSSQFKFINQIEIGENKQNLIKTVKHNYCKAPYFDSCFDLILDILSNKQNNLAAFLEYSIKSLCKYLGINTNLIVSSKIDKNNSLKGQDKILEICRSKNVHTYINPIGGQALYSKDVFDNEGIVLKFLKSNEIVYPQFTNVFIPCLSIIDVMMFNPIEEIRKMLNKYELI